ncbi:MAG: 30S ribosomal protein S17 [Candidatus Eisenbacteria bacterium]|uniref:Small ribosomal subunit protein uS17 n=1 Tax=Eiseniibacteriota bacterium TaxID=2212470 RepID=A0A948RU96_UNCEI|nr:30S ribosomal protein S17 [Candidatus Eisenbacteria bacterium]MBU1951249.1 30S ribosomal protein S17 [Candidatus Eisenbacteria bacterium]MBU2691128.1 30S ribosomal protein S17 [Candidatus Eisenbacteria bacterium]
MAIRGQRKTVEGVIVGNRMNKTVVVSKRRRVPHKVYGKYISLDKKYYAHDEENACQMGDTVRIMETRPYSKLKRWRVVEILSKAESEVETK